MNKKISSFLTIRVTIVVFLSFLCSMGVFSIIIGSLYFFSIDIKFVNPFLFMIILLSLSLCMGALLSYIITKKLSKSFDDIKNVIHSAANGNFESKLTLPDKKNVIINEIYNEINLMIDELNTNTMLKKDFVSNFSHEFKTPIVSIKGYAELLYENNDIDEDTKKKYLKIIIDESNRLKVLASSTMLLTKLDSDIIIKNKELYNLTDQIMECVLLLDNELQKKNIEVSFNTIDIKYNANKNLMKEVFLNLLTNAIKYNKKNGSIEIFSYEDNDAYSISFRDSGYGIEKEKLNYIFDNYYQADKSHNSEGIGLGLSIVKKIIEEHNFAINVKSVVGEGSVFTLVLPKKYE